MPGKLLQTLSLVLFFLSMLLHPIHAQNEQIVISIHVPFQQYESLVFSGIIDDFEDAYPDIQVHVIRSDNLQSFFVQSAEQAQSLAMTADVLYIDSTMVSPNVILDGLFLDLRPLTTADTMLNVGDFHRSVWESFQWDNGMWAIPLTFHPVLLSYDPVAFDQANLTYPDENWTLLDLMEAARTLTVQDTDGTVIRAGLQLPYGTEDWLVRSLLSESLSDTSTYPATPRLNTSGAAELLQTWADLYEAGVIANFGEGQDAPISVSLYLSELDTHPNRRFALLPGGQAGIRINGLAISAGTAYPEQAYQLIKFLSEHPQSINPGRFALPARQSIEAPTTFNNLDPAVRDFLLESVTISLPFHQIRYVDYFSRAVSQVRQGTTPQEALQFFEDMAIEQQQRIVEQQETSTFSVVPAPLPHDVPAGEVVLRFGFHSYTAAVERANQSLWTTTIEDFINSDPEVGQIDMEILINRVDFTEFFDCFFTPHGINHLQPDTLLSLTPLMATDPNFDASDFLPYTLEQVTFHEQVYGYPLIVQFEALDYAVDVFEQAGVPLPAVNWTTSDFTTALQDISAQTNRSPVFGTTRIVSTDLLQLIASFGGLPIDYRTNPPTANFTDPTTITSIQAVLDLITDGYIQYHPRSQGFMSDAIAPIMTNSRGMLGSSQLLNDDNIRSVLYPTGQTYRPISLGVGALYISNTTPYPEACYRWISTIVSTPELVSTGMYATYSAINSPAAEASQGLATIAFYNDVSEQLLLPNAVNIPSPWVGNVSLVGTWLEHWLYEAFTAYVIEGVNLEQALNDAQLNADVYLQCVENLPALDASQNYNTRYQIYRDCALLVDSMIESQP